MVSDIETMPLEALCEEVVDCPHSTPVWTDQGVVVLRSPNIKNGRLDLSNPSFTDEFHYEERSRRARIRGGDVVITREAPMGEVCLIPDDLKCCLGQRMVLLRPSLDVCSGKYLLYALQSRQVQNEIKSHDGTGSTVSNLRIPVLKNLSIPTPSLDNQKVVAHILGTLDDKIELNRKTNETLEGIAKALFKSWFVDFDPVRAKAEGRPTGLPDEISDLFPDSLEDSELGEIPSEWKVSTLGDENEIVMGQSPPGHTYNEEGIGLPFYQGRSDFGFRHPGERVYCSEPSRLAEAGSTLMSVRAPVGSINMANKTCCVGRGVASIRSAQGNHAYTYYSMDSIQDLFDPYNSEGTVFGAINKKDLSAIQVVQPSAGPERIFEQFASQVDRRISLYLDESASLTSLRDALLPRLISGELRVPDAEKMLEEAGV